MQTLTKLDKQIIDAAKTHFYTEGIRNTDMKQLAFELGISRSTLYRHFPSALHIAFYVNWESISFIMGDDEKIYSGLNGFDAFSLYMRRTINRFCSNLPIMRFIKEFDSLYSVEHLATPPEGYSDYMKGDPDLLLVKLFQLGIHDGTIRSDLNPTIVPYAILYSAMGLVERIMLREQIYLEEHGAAREYVDCAADLLLASIRK